MTTMRRMAVVLAVGAILAGGHPAAAEETGPPEVRPGLTLGGQPLARALWTDPTSIVVPFHPALTGLHAQAGGAGQAPGTVPVRSTWLKVFRRGSRGGWIGAGIGAGLGAVGGLYLSSLCGGGPRYPSSVPVLGALGGLAGYGIGKGIAALAGKLRRVQPASAP